MFSSLQHKFSQLYCANAVHLDYFILLFMYYYYYYYWGVLLFYFFIYKHYICSNSLEKTVSSNSRYRQYERNTRMLRSSPIPGAMWDRAVATLFPVWRLRVWEMCIPRGPPARLLFQLVLASVRGYRR